MLMKLITNPKSKLKRKRKHKGKRKGTVNLEVPLIDQLIFVPVRYLHTINDIHPVCIYCKARMIQSKWSEEEEKHRRTGLNYGVEGSEAVHLKEISIYKDGPKNNDY